MFGRLLGDPDARKLRRFAPLVTDINSLESDVSNLTDNDLRSRTSEFRQKLEKESNTKNQLILLE